MSENVMVKAGWMLAALAIASGRPASEAATVAGVSERTVRRWNQDAEFRKLVATIRGEMIEMTHGQLLATNAAAVSTLAALLKSDLDQVKLAAASRLLELTLRVRHQAETEQEIERIKEQWAALQREQPDLFKHLRECTNE